MLSEADKELIINYARKYNVSSVVLFGSSLIEEDKASDIDLAVKGIEPNLFFKFYAELFRDLSKPVDLIDLSISSSFSRFVEKTGVRIYGKTA